MNDLLALAIVAILWVAYKILSLKSRARERRQREEAAEAEVLAFEDLLRREIEMWGGGDVLLSWSVRDSLLEVTFVLGDGRYTVAGTGDGHADAMAGILARFASDREIRRSQRRDAPESPPAHEEPPGWWKVLGVGPESDLVTAERAYRALAKRHHPDKGGSAELMGRINAARDEARSALGG